MNFNEAQSVYKVKVACVSVSTVLSFTVIVRNICEKYYYYYCCYYYYFNIIILLLLWLL
uniref:Uncharacterized protein n=1 Tax=Anguilla anguilla TaxID=7936 RepID=A0A0E9QGR2_ANGAN